MKIPKKITPDRIKSVVLELRYDSDYPLEIILGLAFKHLDDSYTYVSRSSNRFVFYNDLIQIHFDESSISFSYLTENYIGWSVFLPEIKKAYNQIVKSQCFKSIRRIGLRITSEYENMDLKEFVNFTFTFNQPDVQSKNFMFKTQFNFDDCIILLELERGYTKQQEGNEFLISYIDIDSIKEDINISSENVEELFRSIENIHDAEKKVFFSLLKQNFIETLNPIY